MLDYAVARHAPFQLLPYVDDADDDGRRANFRRWLATFSANASESHRTKPVERSEPSQGTTNPDNANSTHFPHDNDTRRHARQPAVCTWPETAKKTQQQSEKRVSKIADQNRDHHYYHKATLPTFANHKGQLRDGITSRTARRQTEI